MNFHDDSPSVPIDNFKDHYVLVFDLTSMQDASEHCHYPELIGEPLRLELNFALESVTEVIILGERMSSVRKIPNMDDIALRQSNDRIPLLKYWYLGSFPSDLVPMLPNDTFANVKTEPSYMSGEHWVMIAKFKQHLYFADSLGGSCKFLKQDYQKMVQ